jgi:hypothetical protein
MGAGTIDGAAGVATAKVDAFAAFALAARFGVKRPIARRVGHTVAHRVAGEVEDEGIRLVGRPPKHAADFLQKQRKRLRGAEQYRRADRRNVDAFGNQTPVAENVERAAA